MSAKPATISKYFLTAQARQKYSRMHCELCAFAALREIRLNWSGFSQRRKGSFGTSAWPGQSRGKQIMNRNAGMAYGVIIYNHTMIFIVFSGVRWQHPLHNK
jgi:hypothetical protein